jgi:hypothetical protein
MVIFIVQEFTAGQWFSLRSFATRADAEDFAARFPKARIITKIK